MTTAVLLLVAFALGAAHAFHRWRTAGVAWFSLLVVVMELIRGSWEWMQPHQHYGPPRSWEWACHSTGAVVPALLLGTGVALTLHLTREAATTLPRRLAVSLATCLVLVAPLLIGVLWWGVGVLSCDTL